MTKEEIDAAERTVRNTRILDGATALALIAEVREAGARELEAVKGRCEREALMADAQVEPSRRDGVSGNPEHWRGYAHAMREHAAWLGRRAEEPLPRRLSAKGRTMNDMKWEPWDARECERINFDGLVESASRDAAKNGLAFSMTGATMVVAVKREDGGVDLYDCLVRRTSEPSR